jgi:DNA-binding GntR family transcriptional regulator
MVETELSERLQISRGTLREAMRQLQQEGLLTAGAARALCTMSEAPADVDLEGRIEAGRPQLPPRPVPAHRQWHVDAIASGDAAAAAAAVHDHMAWAANNLTD